MTIYYLDASAWIKRYVLEGGSRFVIDLFSRNHPLGCSTLGLVEVAATLTRKRKAGNLLGSNLNSAMQTVHQDWERFYQVPLLAPVVRSAVTLTQQEALRGADSLHLASALLLQQFTANRGADIAFVGSDRQLNSAARHFGLSVIDPQETS